MYVIVRLSVGGVRADVTWAEFEGSFSETFLPCVSREQTTAPDCIGISLGSKSLYRGPLQNLLMAYIDCFKTIRSLSE